MAVCEGDPSMMKIRDVWSALEGREPPEGFAALVRVLAVWVAYRPIEWMALRVASLPESAHGEPLLAAGWARRLVPFPLESLGDAIFAGGLLGAALLLILRRRALLSTWKETGDLSVLRPLVLVCAVVLAWAIASSDFNHYFARSHALDRALIVALVPLVAWRPIFVLPFAIESAVWLDQFGTPLGGYAPTHEILPVRVLLLFAAAHALRAISFPLRPRDFVYSAMILIAAGYFHSGISKLGLGWLSFGHIYDIVFATYANGWLGFLSPDTISTVGRFLAPFDPLLVLGAFTLEVGIILMFWRRESAIFMLSLGAAFHVGVVALSGIFFWMWIVIDLAFVLWLVSVTGRRAYPEFSRSAFLASLLLIPAAIFWFRPASLGWLDAPLSYTYRFEARSAEGEPIPLPPAYFSPYRYQFTLGQFDGWSKDKMLPIRWGALSELETANQLVAARTEAEIAAIEERFGRIPFDPRRAERLDDFVRRWVRNKEAPEAARDRLRGLRAPPLLLTYPWTHGPTEASICRVDVRRVTSWFDGERYREIEPRLVRSIEISDSAHCAEADADGAGLRASPNG
jgi:hypothetical protein